MVSDVHGRWGGAVEVPGTAALNTSGWAHVASVSCAAPGDCAAGGVYRDRSFHEQAFTVSEVNGRWATAVEVPGTAALNKGGQARDVSVSCGSVASCGAGGYYTDGSGGLQAFVVSEVNGRWGTAVEVPGTAALNQGGGNANAGVASLSCRLPASCGALGWYTGRSGFLQAFVASEGS